MAHALTLSEIKATSTPDTNDTNRLAQFNNNNFTANSKMPRPGPIFRPGSRPMNPFEESDDDLSMCPNSFSNNLYSPKHFDLKKERSLSFHSFKSDKSNNKDTSNLPSSNINDHSNNENVTNTKRNLSSSFETNDLSYNAHSSTNTSSNLITSFEINDLSINAHSSTNVTNTTSLSSNNSSVFGGFNNSDSLLSAIQNSLFYMRDYISSFIIEEEDIETIPPSQIRRGPTFDYGRYQ
jgi:hypothetical protein